MTGLEYRYHVVAVKARSAEIIAINPNTHPITMCDMIRSLHVKDSAYDQDFQAAVTKLNEDGSVEKVARGQLPDFRNPPKLVSVDKAFTMRKQQQLNVETLQGLAQQAAAPLRRQMEELQREVTLLRSETTMVTPTPADRGMAAQVTAEQQGSAMQPAAAGVVAQRIEQAADSEQPAADPLQNQPPLECWVMRRRQE
jgi:hypothetical protein